MEQAQDYLQKHHIPELLNHVTECLVYQRPPRVTPFMMKLFNQMKDVRDHGSEQKIEHPNMKQINGRAIYKMLDPQDKGNVKVAALKEILAIYNLENNDSKLFEYYSNNDTISQETFIHLLDHDLAVKSCCYMKRDEKKSE